MEIPRKSIPLQSMCIFLSCIISMKLLLSIHTRPQRQFQAFRAYINNNFNTFNYLPFLFFYCIPQKTFLKSETELSIYTITAKHHELVPHGAVYLFNTVYLFVICSVFYRLLLQQPFCLLPLQELPLPHPLRHRRPHTRFHATSNRFHPQLYSP